MAQRAVFHLDVIAKNCRVEVRLNDIPVFRGDTGGAFTTRPVHFHLLDGRNQLRLIAGVGPSPSAVYQPSGERFPDGLAHARLTGYEEGDTPSLEAGRTLLEARWTGAGELKPLPRVVDADTDLGVLFGTRLWCRLPTLELDSGMRRAAAAALAHELRESLVSGRVDDYARLVANRVRDTNAMRGARGIPTDSDVGPFARHFGPGGDADLAPLEPEAFDFRVVGDGRLIELTNRDGVATLRARSRGGASFDLPMLLGLVDGRLSVVH